MLCLPARLGLADLERLPTSAPPAKNGWRWGWCSPAGKHWPWLRKECKRTLGMTMFGWFWAFLGRLDGYQCDIPLQCGRTMHKYSQKGDIFIQALVAEQLQFSTAKNSRDFLSGGNPIQPVATPTAGGMAGMGSGSKFLEAKLGLKSRPMLGIFPGTSCQAMDSW